MHAVGSAKIDISVFEDGFAKNLIRAGTQELDVSKVWSLFLCWKQLPSQERGNRCPRLVGDFFGDFCIAHRGRVHDHTNAGAAL